MKDERVLVTGGAGFIGSNVANYLSEENDVIALDDLYFGTADHLDDGVEFVEKSVLDDDLPSDVDVLVHLAALSERTMLEENPRDGARVNVEGFVNAVEQCTADGCESIVYASSSSVYDNDPPGRETDDITAGTGYEASMLSRERYAEFYDSTLEDVSIAGTRFFSVYQGFEAAEGHKGTSANTVSQWADKMARGERPVIWGDGAQTRDYIHVSDVVRAIEAVADNRLSGVYNVGTGTNYSFNETIEILNRTLGTDIEPEYEPVPLSNYNFAQLSDISKITDDTGWEPEISFEEGVELLCDPYL